MSVVLFPPPRLAPAVPEAAYGCAWLTALGAFVLALAPGYFGVLALVEVVTRG